MFSCQTTEKTIAHRPKNLSSSKIARGTNRIYAEVLEEKSKKTNHDNFTDYQVKVLKPEAMGGGGKILVKNQELVVRVSKGFRDLYAKNKVNVADYFQKGKQLTLTIKPISASDSIWKVIELHY